MCQYCEAEHGKLWMETRYTRINFGAFGSMRTLEVTINQCPKYALCSSKNMNLKNIFTINFCPACGRDLRNSAPAIKSFSEVDFDSLSCPSIGIFVQDDDGKKKYSARAFDINGKTDYVIWRPTIEALMEDIEANTDFFFEPVTHKESGGFIGCYH